VTFKRLVTEEANRPRRRRRPKSQKPFTPIPDKPRRMRVPSKTRIARAIARAKNMEQKRTAALYKIKLKPKSAYEKRLYKPEARPASQE